MLGMPSLGQMKCANYIRHTGPTFQCHCSNSARDTPGSACNSRNFHIVPQIRSRDRSLSLSGLELISQSQILNRSISLLKFRISITKFTRYLRKVNLRRGISVRSK